jgi:hypothetical protein
MDELDLTHVQWRKSRYSGGNGACVEVAVIPAWHTSTHSNAQSNCVEVATNLPGRVAIRDSKQLDGPRLVVSAGEWRWFLAAVRGGRFQ